MHHIFRVAIIDTRQNLLNQGLSICLCQFTPPYDFIEQLTPSGQFSDHENMGLRGKEFVHFQNIWVVHLPQISNFIL